MNYLATTDSPGQQYSTRFEVYKGSCLSNRPLTAALLLHLYTPIHQSSLPSNRQPVDKVTIRPEKSHISTVSSFHHAIFPFNFCCVGHGLQGFCHHYTSLAMSSKPPTCLRRSSTANEPDAGSGIMP
ncbi:hypothetical protein Pst134EB_026478 [Puccinia striiformis f. sp. tritici]|nr:hypothetical protein Pst134EB_026478 [Puccinia striiformis f. sp. tritici]